MKRILIIPAIIFLLVGCSRGPKAFQINKNNATQLSFEEATKDVRVVPIKSSEVLPPLDYLQSYGEELLAMDQSHKIICYFRNDTLISMLNSVGNGPNEYLSIDKYSYNPHNKVLYVISMNKNTILWYSVPEMNCIGKTPLNIYPISIQVHDDDTFLLSCESDSAYFLAFVDIKTGDILTDPINIGGYTSVVSPTSLMGYNYNHSFTLVGNTNTVLHVSDNLKIDTLFVYDFGKNALPKKYVDYQPYEDSKSLQLALYIYSPDGKESVRSGYYTKSSKNDLSFWFRKEQATDDYFYFHASPSDTTIIRGFDIPGLNKSVHPHCITEDGYITMYQGLSSSIIDEGTTRSNLANEIIKAMDSQEESNPILLYYSICY